MCCKRTCVAWNLYQLRAALCAQSQPRFIVFQVSESVASGIKNFLTVVQGILSFGSRSTDSIGARFLRCVDRSLDWNCATVPHQTVACWSLFLFAWMVGGVLVFNRRNRKGEKACLHTLEESQSYPWDKRRAQKIRGCRMQLDERDVRNGGWPSQEAKIFFPVGTDCGIHVCNAEPTL